MTDSELEFKAKLFGLDYDDLALLKGELAVKLVILPPTDLENPETVSSLSAIGECSFCGKETASLTTHYLPDRRLAPVPIEKAHENSARIREHLNEYHPLGSIVRQLLEKQFSKRKRQKDERVRRFLAFKRSLGL